MDNVIIINGMPASGKSTISTILAETFMQKGINVKIIFGDLFANISYGCKYTESEIDLKYENITSVLRNLFELNGIVIIDDFFKRKKDFENIKELISSNGLEVITVQIQCGLEERIIRDSFRYSGKRLGKEKMIEYEINYGKINGGMDCICEVNTEMNGIKESVNKIIDYIQKQVN